MSKPWFDPETGELMWAHYAAELPSYRRAADGEVTHATLAEQAAVAYERLRDLEASLTPEQHLLATAAMSELAALHMLHQYCKED